MNLLIVESRAKARTIEKYLGDDFLVRACMGHVQDLPTEGKQGRKAMWASSENRLPEPPWEWTDGAEEVLRDLIREAEERGVERFYIATDPDREGEFIAWRLSEILGDRGEVYRITFHEITAEAVREALEDPRPVDPNLVDSARVRRFMDRLVGFRASKFARSWFSGTTSMGRVQTPTLGFVVERELEREAFVPVPYFRVLADAEGVPYQVLFHDADDEEAWMDEKGRFHPDRTHDGDLARAAFEAVEAAGRVTVTGVERGTYSRNPRSPFTTETLLGAAGSELGWTPGRTMGVASRLYNDGHITYIRTDSTRTGEGPRRRVRKLVAERWGKDHLGKGAVDADSSGPIQDAHEAIRPTRPEVEVPDGLDDPGQERLYRLIWARFAASQMAPSRYQRAKLEARVGGDGGGTAGDGGAGGSRDASGPGGNGRDPDFDRPLEGTVRWRTHAGWEAAYEGIRPPPPEAPPTDALEEGAVHRLDPATEEKENPRFIEDETKPPARYRQHTLIRKMKEEGIGRPSTYAPTVEKLLDRQYCLEEGNELVPTEKGRTLWRKIVPFYAPADGGDGRGEVAADGTEGRGEPPRESEGEEGPGDGLDVDVFSPDFTAEMEEMLDEIEEGRTEAPREWLSFRDRFRAMHNVALERRRRRPTPSQLSLARRLLEGAPEEARDEALEGRDPDALEEISGEEVSEIISRLREGGGGTLPPTEKQLAYIATLAGEVGLGESEAAGLVDVDSFDDLTGGRDGTASDLIEKLKERRAELPRPASPKQLKFIESLAKKAELEESEAAGLVGADSFDDLTGGREGTASELIDSLQERVKAEKG